MTSFSEPDQSQSIPIEILRQCIFLAGPTASGKTDVSLLLAERLGNLEIVSLDSMTLYRGMDVGTAKPSRRQRDAVPHHLIDIIDPEAEFSVAEYLTAARSACEEITARGHRPLFVGGTGLYLRSVLRGVFEGPPADWSIRDRLEQQAKDAASRGDHYWLMRQLEKVDSESALRLHPNDQRRLIRAIEVYELTGQPLSKQQNQPALPVDQRPPHVYWLDPSRDWLHDRINRRVEQMLDVGLIEEVRFLMGRPQGMSHTARQGLGYKEVIDALGDDASAELSAQQLAEAQELIQTRTRQFAKRQTTWFRNLEECSPITLKGDESPADITELVLARLN